MSTQKIKPLVFTPTAYASRTIAAIRKPGESKAETVNRILETLCASAPDFDHFYGPRQTEKMKKRGK